MIAAGIWFQPFEITQTEIATASEGDLRLIESLHRHVAGMQMSQPRDGASPAYLFRARPSITSMQTPVIHGFEQQ